MHQAAKADISHRHGRRRFLWGVVVALAALGGCQKGPTFAPVTGTVTLDGRPVVDAGVLFAPLSAENQPATGQTDKEGRFRLMTEKQEGAALGEYRVSVTKMECISLAGAPSATHIKWITPQKYCDPKTSGFQATVGLEGNDFTFKLSSR